MSERWSDGELLDLLATALREAAEVPQDFVNMGKAVFTMRDLDAELAELTYDSALGDPAGALTRAETASLRNLTFTAALLKIELEISPTALQGQLIPPQPGEVTVETRDGPAVTAPIDDIGCFTLRPCPAGYFRLHCRTSAGQRVSTSWIALTIPPG